MPKYVVKHGTVKLSADVVKKAGEELELAAEEAKALDKDGERLLLVVQAASEPPPQDPVTPTPQDSPSTTTENATQDVPAKSAGKKGGK